MLVCYIMATPANNRTEQETLVAKLFDNLNEIDPASGYANYQLAAMIGTLEKTELCAERYAR